MTFGDYIQHHIFGPLGLKSPTFQLNKHPETQKRLMKMTARTMQGELVESVKPWPDNAPQECAGSGLHCSVLDYVRIIGDLIKDSPALLEREIIDKELFVLQFAPGSLPLKGLLSSPIIETMTGAPMGAHILNFNPGGLCIEKDMNGLKAGTLMWGWIPKPGVVYEPEARCGGDVRHSAHTTRGLEEQRFGGTIHSRNMAHKVNLTWYSLGYQTAGAFAWIDFVILAGFRPDECTWP
jgi:CubicO group peptidase (beta-lactamase class C family)